MPPEPCLSVVIPCYNEETTVLEVVRVVLESPWVNEVVIVDDGSSDGTRTTLERIAAWCTRYTPWTAPSGLETGGAAGLWLDASGCAHLFGGETAMLLLLVGSGLYVVRRVG